MWTNSRSRRNKGRHRKAAGHRSKGGGDADGRDPMSGHPEETPDEILAEQTANIAASVSEGKFDRDVVDSNSRKMMPGRMRDDPAGPGSPVRVVVDSYDDMTDSLRLTASQYESGGNTGTTLVVYFTLLDVAIFARVGSAVVSYFIVLECFALKASVALDSPETVK
ncbi:hypothetical protein BIW11_10569 [Tropilaelaps mercedesae]|uniref:Uncharacterized protein n=1 Tax=Tropilaelaps mercedesae TaxID=418985 RepID=A0A1V9XF74_9ACAR|nr:hypothetical protein BIW11_10569 [Tropilaelaps mercedesae]